MNLDQFMHWLGVAVVLVPAMMVVILGSGSLLNHKYTERFISRAVQCCIVVGFIAALLLLALMLSYGYRHVPINLGNLVHLHGLDGEAGYHFAVKFIFDRLSVPFAILSFLLCGTIAAFATRYMHREPGFNRFFTLFAFFVLGMVVTSLAGTIETLFVGWELVGLSSTLLVAFFHERPSPVRNGLRVWVVYRISDAALLTASVVLHHLTGAGDFEKLMGIESWPDQTHLGIDSHQALLVGSLLLVAAAGKSGLVPFSGWLPRAMEGPTPSSAVFYGALSVHLGAFLLLRISPLLDSSLLLSSIVVVLGLLTAIFAAVAGRVQTDIKSALSFASLTQVGIITAEIGLGLRYIPLIHILGHACLRTLQFIRAPTLLHDYRLMENALGERFSARPSGEILFSERLRLWIYRYALERGYLDALLIKFLVNPFLGVLRFCDRCERRWTDFLAGGQSRESESRELRTSPIEELL
jgi:NADH:ubiquinone oxidoreductase subunit 5 (subunit L)/multisubunit Na+/H+ antiporter MnhA subunit